MAELNERRVLHCVKAPCSEDKNKLRRRMKAPKLEPPNRMLRVELSPLLAPMEGVPHLLHVNYFGAGEPPNDDKVTARAIESLPLFYAQLTRTIQTLENFISNEHSRPDENLKALLRSNIRLAKMAGVQFHER